MTSNPKTYTLHSSGSLSKILQNQKTTFQKNAITKLYLAKKKLLPVINDVIKTAKEMGSKKPLDKSYYLTVDQYKDAVWASQILKEVNDMFIHNKFRKHLTKSFRTNRFNFDCSDVKVNRGGKIYVDTAILVQLIELHNILGEIIDYIQEVPLEAQTDGLTETDASSKPSKLEDILDELEENTHFSGRTNKLTKEILTSLTFPLHNKYVVLTAESSDTRKNLTTLPEEGTSNSEVNLTDDTQKGTRKTKSTSSLMDDEKSQVTDAAGARRIIVRCMSDLDKVRHYLERDFVTGISSVEHGLDLGEVLEEPDRDIQEEPEDREENRENQEEDQEDQDEDREDQEEDREDQEEDQEDRKEQEDRQEDQEVPRQRSSIKSDRKVSHVDHDDRKCCCSEECPADQPLEFTWQEDGETSSKLIICIKGKSEEEGDVHIVIKQCPECKLFDGGLTSSTPRDQSRIGVASKTKELSREPSKVKEVPRDPSKIKDIPRDPSKIKDIPRDPSKPKDISRDHVNFESEILHGKDPEEDCDISSLEEIEGPENLNIIFNTTDPSKSVVEGARKRSQQQKSSPHLDPAKTISTIKLNETINLNLQTEEGPELIISLTVRPKTQEPILDLKEIFSESQTDVPERDRDQPEKDEAPKEGDDEDDLVIPLSRTKICSSLEFDVQTVNSRMKATGIKHKNANITFRLNDLGVNNLLRASRPVKCGRKAVLNETLMKCLPYSPSLKSLPLEDVDTEIIDQSLNMSVTKSKHSTIYMKESKMSHTLGMNTSRKPPLGETRSKQVYFVYVHFPKVMFRKDSEKKTSGTANLLGFYINLESDIREEWPIFDVRYFVIENIEKDLCDKTDPPETVFSVRLKNRRANVVTDDDKLKVNGLERKKLSSSSDSSKFSSKIPIYKYRKWMKSEERRNRMVDVYNVTLGPLPEKSKDSEGLNANSNSVVSCDKQMNHRPSQFNHAGTSAFSLKRSKNKSLLTVKNVSQTNTIELFPAKNFTSVESLEYFNSFLRNAAIFQGSTTSRGLRKKKEFYESRSHSLLVMRASTEHGNTGDVTKLATANEANGIGKKCIRHNNVDLSSTQFKKQLNIEKNVSKMLINDLSTFIYENFIKDLSSGAKLEIFKKIDSFLSSHSKIKGKMQSVNRSGSGKGSWRTNFDKNYTRNFTTLQSTFPNNSLLQVF
ncbi:uncharacterized protein isoform X1 [Leptinotarsa decemlineata]|uniref:uncharacterized protein isoform X1 n=2 Tax=Leptinotarsa decemlineata TaxID=7539 RepID=UPI003D306724